MDAEMRQTRVDELSASLAQVRARIVSASGAAQRDPAEVTLVVVTKFFPASDVRLLHDLGVRDVGESRHQEAVVKVAQCSDLSLRWHFVGGIQSNKSAAVASYADVVGSVDRAKVISSLGSGADRRQRPLEVLLQVSLDGAGGTRAGASPADLDDLAALVTATPALRLGGLMAVAPLGENPDLAFARLATIRSDFVGRWPDASVLSAGMSGDLEAAIRHGATHVRVGSAVLGARPTIL
jgi:PLP dependent protein